MSERDDDIAPRRENGGGGPRFPAPRDLGPEEVKAWLRAHPDFFQAYPEILEDVMAPAIHHGDNVADFQHFMTERIRRDRAELETQLGDLVEVSRANLHSQSRIHSAVLRLLDARSFEAAIHTILTDFAALLDVDVITLGMEARKEDLPHAHQSGVRVLPPGGVAELLDAERLALFGDEDLPPGLPAVFGGLAELVHSAALIRLEISSQSPDGLLAFGSRDPEMFQPGQATELMRFLAGTVERVIRSWLDLPA